MCMYTAVYIIIMHSGPSKGGLLIMFISSPNDDDFIDVYAYCYNNYRIAVLIINTNHSSIAVIPVASHSV